ncbi:hypothetical protein ARHIZOSPH14_24280 [Agromyces rhizosphaerae]|uniref:Uncharacterized protein n=1 Tax=Agromyces rhizosphaerae TaxID=88374 RepID=A0A9W6FQ41_9MICO|nr:hypothetical protein [Agromyces rhizosphaerae]GLI28186.1 hypothetical protein ARHIZOSPH14_24280 [Agromyces rhizosphaerae]
MSPGESDEGGPERADAADGEASRKRPRQRVERATGARRARLTPAPGSDPAPEAPERDAEPTRKPKPGASADDDRITRERPPHW